MLLKVKALLWADLSMTLKSCSSPGAGGFFFLEGKGAAEEPVLMLMLVLWG